MIELITTNRWGLLITAEIVFWSTIITAITLRYWFNKPRAAFYIFLLTLINEIWILFLGIIDIKETRQLSIFQIIVVIIILYTLILGKYDLRKLDRILFRSVARLKGTKITQDIKISELQGISKAKELKQFGLHVVLFLLAQCVFFIILLLTSKERPFSLLDQVEWLFQNNKSLMNVNKVWAVILLIDGIRSLSYLFLEKKEPE